MPSRRIHSRGRPESGQGPKPEPPADPEADPEAVAREIVLRKLTAQARSREELAKALASRNVPEQAAAGVLDRLEKVGLVDDSAFAESWVQSRQARRNLSKRALRQELLRKGVGRDDIDQALDQVGSDDEYAAARELAAKRLRSMSGLDRAAKYRRLGGALGRRGFPAGVTARVLSELLDTGLDQDPEAHFGTDPDPESDPPPLDNQPASPFDS